MCRLLSKPRDTRKDYWDQLTDAGDLSFMTNNRRTERREPKSEKAWSFEGSGTLVPSPVVKDASEVW